MIYRTLKTFIVKIILILKFQKTMFVKGHDLQKLKISITSVAC